MKIRIITEGNENLGLGHITRCLSIYRAFEEEGYNSKIIAPPNTATIKLLKKTNYIPLNWTTSSGLLINEIKRSDIIILDSPTANLSYYVLIFKNAKVPVFIDDNKRLNYPKGVIINRTINASKFNFPKNGSIYLLGTKYLPISKEFRNIPNKKINSKIENILIMFGGSDPNKTTEKVLKLIVEKFPYTKKVVLLGSAYGDDSLVKKIKDKKTSILYHPTGRIVANAMLNADIAISAGGQTLYELARIGVPTIAVKIADNQKNNINGLKNKRTGGIVKVILMT